jgi:hypothetical protein
MYIILPLTWLYGMSIYVCQLAINVVTLSFVTRPSYDIFSQTLSSGKFLDSPEHEVQFCLCSSLKT